jgi:hypothetical protein
VPNQKKEPGLLNGWRPIADFWVSQYQWQSGGQNPECPSPTLVGAGHRRWDVRSPSPSKSLPKRMM